MKKVEENNMSDPESLDEQALQYTDADRTAAQDPPEYQHPEGDQDYGEWAEQELANVKEKFPRIFEEYERMTDEYLPGNNGH